MLVQLAARGGASTVAVTTSTVDRGGRLRQLGATRVLDRDGDMWPTDPPTTTAAPAGYDIILDLIAGPHISSFIAKLNPNGRLVTVGALAGRPSSAIIDAMYAAFHKSLSFAMFSANGSCVSEVERRAVTGQLFEAASRGEVRAVVHEVLPLEQAVIAHEKLLRGEVFGRLVLTPSPSSELR